MHNRIKNRLNIAIGIFLLLVAITFYLLLHGTEKLLVFSFCKDFWLLEKLEKVHSVLIERYSDCSKNVFISGYLVDSLWFLSFCFFLVALQKNQQKEKDTTSTQNFQIEKTLKLFITSFLLGLFSEVLQFFYPMFGTFDIWDILLYFSLSVIFSFVSYLWANQKTKKLNQ